MLLRRITEHVKAQNWTAVALDFVIVVVGVFIGIQVSNWNDARQYRLREAAVLAQLNEEFTDIKEALERQIRFRTRYMDNIGALITTLEGTGPPASDEKIKAALDDATSSGRRPAQSAAYLQLTANGELATLNNEKLEKALIRYHTLLERDAFLHPALIKTVVEEVATNEFVDLDVLNTVSAGAAIDDRAVSPTPGHRVKSYDLEGLRAYEKRYETLFLLHSNLRDTDQRQLNHANEILELIENEEL